MIELFIIFVIVGMWYIQNLLPDFPLWVTICITVFGVLAICIDNYDAHE